MIKLRFKSFINLLKKVYNFLLLFFLIIFITTFFKFNFFSRVSTENITNSFDSSCQKPKKNIVFLKTHKCASSTIQNIILRYGYKNKLKFALPSKGNYLGHPSLFSRNLIPPGKYNVIAHHTRFNYPEMKLVVPNNTIFITILRNPVELFESMYNYYNLEKFYKFKFEMFNSDNLTFIPDMSKRYANRIGTNQMFFDLGFKANKYGLNYEPFFKYIDSIFHLVMIEEFMDESLILLKNILCWSTNDLISFKVNARIKKSIMNKIAVDRIKKLNYVDVELYEYFLKKFYEKIAELDKDKFEKEVQDLKNKRKILFEFCVDKKKLKQPKNVTNSQTVTYEVKRNNLDCKLLASKELALTKLVRKSQARLYPNSIYNKFSFFKRKIKNHHN